MTQSNLEKYKSDLKKLIHDGRMLEVGLQFEHHRQAFEKLYKKDLGDKYEDFSRSSPVFRPATSAGIPKRTP